MVCTGSGLTAPQERGADLSLEIDTVLKRERAAQQVPALAVVVVRSDDLPRVYVSGERRLGKGDLLTPADRMHLGSLTKAITATMIGALVEKGQITFETTIGGTFPELSARIQPAYRDVTVRQLLSHAAGIPAYRTTGSLRWMLALKGTPAEQRYAMMERVLAEPPLFEPGTRREYSNAGAGIAGAMAERITGISYPQLVQRLIFAPLGGTALFGNPGRASEPQPWGHVRTAFGALTEVAPLHPVYTTPLAIEPAGDASPAMRDYGRFLQMHLRGLKGRDDVLKAATIHALHGRGTQGGSAGTSALGWSVMPRPGVDLSHENVGSSGAYVAFATIQPSRDIAVAAFTNMGGGQDLRDAVGRLALRIATLVSTTRQAR
jgi:CubicO group peptidase (beta-lactamase class C family)